jgi:hypothetical protein
MRKWPLLLALSLSGLGLYVPAFAADDNAVMPTAAAALMCMPLVQQGDAIPPRATTHLDTLKLCMNNCDSLYQPLADQGHLEEMLRGASNCRKSLNNLYFASVAQTITDQLNQDTQQKQDGAKQSAFETLSAAMLMKRQAQQAQTHPEVEDIQPMNDASIHTDTPAPPANPQPSPGPADNINW